ncbi:MAG: hypothetical protein IMX04_08245 [Candidatus Carbobacillus altaicus]|nr:hypothetical protein [Candidatus Carbobacillus altaicus]
MNAISHQERCMSSVLDFISIRLNTLEETDLIYTQFEKLSKHFIAAQGLNTDEARMDSTQIMSNIKLAGRLSLAYDVLVNAVKALPEHLMTDALKVFLRADDKTHFLYQLKKQDTPSRIQNLIDQGSKSFNTPRNTLS